MIDVSGSEWRHALEVGLGAKVVEVGGPGDGNRRLAVFTRGPLKVGYADFAAGTMSLADGYEEAMLAIARRHRVDVIRYQAPTAVRASPAYARHALATTLIPALQSWDERALEKPRRASNRMRRTELQLRRGHPKDAAVMHELYLETMKRHGGARRYSEAYFAAIAGTSSWVACLQDEVVGFVATGRAGQRGLYLHGGHRESARRHYPSDLLFLAMLREAKAARLDSFDFLASPPNQQTLLDYKRAWGATVQPVVVSDHPLGWRGRAFSLAYAGLAAFKRR